MKKILLIVICFSVLRLAAQDDGEKVNLDLLNAPSSPGFILLNQQPTDIERPLTPTDFAVSLRNSTENFSAIPKNYAVEMAPYWLLNRKNISFENAYGIDSRKFGQTFLQTFNLSLAYAPVDSLIPKGASQFGFGFKCSLKRGETNSAFLAAVGELNKIIGEIGRDLTQKAEAELEKRADYAKLLDEYLQKSSNMHSKADSIEAEAARVKLQELENKIKNEFIKTYVSPLEAKRKEQIKKIEEVDMTRRGYFLDLAGGSVLDFPTRVFDYSEINKFGVWLTFGKEVEDFSWIVLGRFLQNKKTPFLSDSSVAKTMNSTALDIGGRLIYKKEKFNASIEALYRNNIGPEPLTPGWKATLNLSYEVDKNKVLTFNIGRDFDNTITKKGNLVTALNLIIGLGSKRSIK